MQHHAQVVDLSRALPVKLQASDSGVEVGDHQEVEGSQPAGQE